MADATGTATINYGFKTIAGSDVAGYTSINSVITSIDTKVKTVLPTGMIVLFGKGSTTAGIWLKCDGSAVNRVKYADLFAAIGTTHGAGDGTATFNLPSLTAPTNCTYMILPSAADVARP
jgi:hypothetical protein